MYDVDDYFINNYIISGLVMLRLHALKNWLPMIVIGYTLELLQLLTNFILEERLESQHLELIMEESKEMV